MPRSQWTITLVTDSAVTAPESTDLVEAMEELFGETTELVTLGSPHPFDDAP
jgi:hypothetical protein